MATGLRGARRRRDRQGRPVAGVLDHPQEACVREPAAYSPGISTSRTPRIPWSSALHPVLHRANCTFGTAEQSDHSDDGLLPALTNEHFVGHLNLKDAPRPHVPEPDANRPDRRERRPEPPSVGART